MNLIFNKEVGNYELSILFNNEDEFDIPNFILTNTRISLNAEKFTETVLLTAQTLTKHFGDSLIIGIYNADSKDSNFEIQFKPSGNFIIFTLEERYSRP
jgi:hypothetical protein